MQTDQLTLLQTGPVSTGYTGLASVTGQAPTGFDFGALLLALLCTESLPAALETASSAWPTVSAEVPELSRSGVFTTDSMALTDMRVGNDAQTAQGTLPPNTEKSAANRQVPLLETARLGADGPDILQSIPVLPFAPAVTAVGCIPAMPTASTPDELSGFNSPVELGRKSRSQEVPSPVFPQQAVDLPMSDLSPAILTMLAAAGQSAMTGALSTVLPAESHISKETPLFSAENAGTPVPTWTEVAVQENAAAPVPTRSDVGIQQLTQPLEQGGVTLSTPSVVLPAAQMAEVGFVKSAPKNQSTGQAARNEPPPPSASGYSVPVSNGLAAGVPTREVENQFPGVKIDSLTISIHRQETVRSESPAPQPAGEQSAPQPAQARTVVPTDVSADDGHKRILPQFGKSLTKTEFPEPGGETSLTVSKSVSPGAKSEFDGLHIQIKGESQTVQSSVGAQAPAAGGETSESDVAEVTPRAQFLTEHEPLRSPLRPGAEIRLRLQPDALGNVKLQLRMVENHLAARVVVDSPAARQAVESNLAQLQRTLADAGLVIDRFEVTVGHTATASPADSETSAQKRRYTFKPKTNRRYQAASRLEKTASAQAIGAGWAIDDGQWRLDMVA